MQCPSLKSPPLWYGSGFPKNKVIIMHSLLNKCKKTHVLNGISSRAFEIFNFFFNLIVVYQYHTSLKISLKNSIHNLNFEIYIQIFKLCDEYYFVTNILHMFKLLIVC
jgi:hypothetical protein